MDVELREALERAGERPDEVLDATEYVGRAAESASRPQKFLAGEEQTLYSVKFRNNRHGNGRALVAEHMAGSFGTGIGAPVAPVALIRVSQGLLDAQPDGLRLENDNSAVPGIHHGSAWVDECIGPSGPEHVDANRPRFAALLALYTWLHCSNDQQFLYTASTDSVISVDHSPFLPNGPGGWTKEALDTASPPTPDPVLSAIGLVPSDFTVVVETLKQVTIDDLAEPVARLPDEWGVDDEDRLSLLNYLATRREAVVDLLR